MEHLTNNAMKGDLLITLNKEPEWNLFLIGDLMNFGIHTEFQDFYIKSEKNAISSVLLRYHHSLVLFSANIASDLSACGERINQITKEPGRWMLSGMQSTINALKPLVLDRIRSTRSLRFAVCSQLNRELEEIPLHRVIPTTSDDLPEVVDLLNAIPEFAPTRFDLDHYRWAVEQGSKKVVHIRDPKSGRVVSTATLDAESDKSGMILAVATHVDPTYRNHGFASACVHVLVEYLQKKGKSACLFYQSPESGRIYRRLGFCEIGDWGSMGLETTP